MSNEELEILLFKIYLAFNEELIKKESLVIESVKPYNQYPSLICLAIGQSLPTFDISNYNLKLVYLGQAIKAIYLFEFLTENDASQLLLKKLYERFQVQGYKDFLRKLFPLAGSVISAKKEGAINIQIKKDDNYNSTIGFLDKLSVNIVNYTDVKVDYLTIRANPLYKTSDSNYRIISPLFTVEKIFNGLYFIFKEINDDLPKDLKIDLRQLITFDFSEKYILYKIIERVYGEDTIKIPGSQMNFPGATDYYLRVDNNVFIFESKDIFIRADIKESYDFSNYEKALREKLYFEKNKKKEDAKAVRQLVNFSKIILNKDFEVDKGFCEGHNIYPIILLHNRQLDILGLNNLTNIWYDIEINKLKEEGIQTDKLKKPTIMHIDTLLSMHEDIKSGKYKLHELLDEYQYWISDERKRKQDFRTHEELVEFSHNQLISFNMFFDMKYGWNLPSLFNEKALSIVKPSA